MSRRNLVLLIVASVLVVSAAVFAFIKLRKLEEPVRDPLDVIPSTAFCLFSSDNVRETWKNFNQGNLVWDACQETDWARKTSTTLAYVDSLLGADPAANELLKGQRTWLSLHCTGEKDFDYVVSTALPSTTDMEDFSVFVKKNAAGKKIAESEWKKSKLITVGDLKAGGFVIAFREGIVAISGNEELLKSGMDQLDNGNTLKKDKNFVAVQQTAGEKVTGNAYLNYARFTVALKRISSEANKERMDALADFSGWTELDLSLRPNAVLLNGYTYASDTSAAFLHAFKSQEPQRIEADQVFPANTISYIDFGISNADAWFADYENYLTQNGNADERRTKLNELAIANRYSPSEDIGKWLGNELALVEFPGPSGEATSAAFFSTTNTAQAKEILSALNARQDSVLPLVQDSSGYTIQKVPVPGMLPVTFGSMFDDLHEAYYTVLHQYVVFAPDEKTLRSIITANENGQTLARNSAYSDFATNISREANLTVYAAPGHCENELRERASASFAEDLKNHLKLLRKFDGACLQYSAGNKGLFYTNIFLRHNPQGKKDIATLWETQLDSTFSGKPWLVNDHKTNGLDIFLQDDANKIYLISSTGTILWKRQLSEKLIGEVQQVDGLKNGKLQLAFNTASSIFVVDRNGNDLAPFPLKLPAPATNQVSVMDYDGVREYRLIVACADKKVYNYTIKGEKVDGWKPIATSDVVLVPVQHTTVESKDYVIIVDQSGKTYITDRQGNTRLNLKQKLNFPVRQVFLETGKDLKHTRIVSCDSLGNVSRLTLSDELERMHFLDFRQTPGFAYSDIDGDGAREFIFLESQRLMVFNQDKNTVLSYASESEVLPTPQIFTFDQKDVRIGIVSRGNSELHLINRGGSDAEGFPLPGNTLFAIGRLNGENGFTLVCGNHGKYICAYPLQ